LQHCKKQKPRKSAGLTHFTQSLLALLILQVAGFAQAPAQQNRMLLQESTLLQASYEAGWLFRQRFLHTASPARLL
jgi:hypothetical protein